MAQSLISKNNTVVATSAILLGLSIVSMCGGLSAKAGEMFKSGQFTEWRSNSYYLGSSKQEISAYERLLDLEYEEISRNPEKYSVKYRIVVLGRCAERLREKSINKSMKEAESELALQKQIQKLLLTVRPPSSNNNYQFYYVSALHSLARVLIAAKEYDRAEKHLQDALAADDQGSNKRAVPSWDHSSILGDLAWTKHKLGDDAEAKRYFDMIFKEPNPGFERHSAVLTYIDFLRDTGRTTELQQYLQLSRQLRARIRHVFTKYDLSEQYSSARYLREANASREWSRVEMARKLATRALESATCETDKSQAQTFLKCSLPQTSIPTDVEQMFFLGIEAKRDHDWEDARERFLICAKEAPNFEWVYRQLSDLDLKIHDLKGAEQYAARSVEINPDYARGWVQLALVKKAQDDASSMWSALNKAEDLDPNDALLTEVKTELQK
jgi:tetratricopeptide (TPR) repeat protein